MKLILAAVLGLLSPALHAADFIRQIQTMNGKSVTYDLPISGDSGSTNSQPLSADSAIFQLYTTYTDASNVSKLLMLNEKTVGTYVPTVTLTIQSADPAVPARTRADIPYGINIVVSGMQSGEGIPAYSKEVNLIRSYTLNDAQHKPTTTAGEYSGSFGFYANTTAKGTTSTAIYPQLPGASPLKTSGKETFTAYTQSSSNSKYSQLAQTGIDIWPVATVTLSGLEQKIYQEVPKNANVIVLDVYPGSALFTQFYKGEQKNGTTGTRLPNAAVNFAGTTTPQYAMLGFEDLPGLITTDGTYTVEVVALTPFGSEIISAVTFQLKRALKVNGSLSTME